MGNEDNLLYFTKIIHLFVFSKFYMRKLESSKKVGWIKTMNSLGKKKIPFLFILDFELHNPIVFPLDKLPKNIYYKVNNIKNYSLSGILAKPLIFK